jgi:hypothetical protein
MNADTSRTASLLRLTAFFGAGAVLLWRVVSIPQLQPRQGGGFIVLVVAALAVGFTLLTLLTDATVRLLRHKDLLVPLGLLITLTAILNSLAALPALGALLVSSWPVKFLAFGVSLSLSLVFTLFLSVVYVGWTTALIFQAVVLGQVNLTAALAIIRRWFWRVIGLEMFGWGVMLAASAGALIIGAVSMPLAVFLLGVASLLWNLATAAVLPVALLDPQPFRRALRRGLAISRAGVRKWAPLVIAQMLLLGWITFIHVSYATHGASSRTERTQTNWGVNGFWVGGYADSCKWHGSLMKALEAEPLEVVDILLTVLFAILAIAIKLKIVGDVYRPITIREEVPVV